MISRFWLASCHAIKNVVYALALLCAGAGIMSILEKGNLIGTIVNY